MNENEPGWAGGTEGPEETANKILWWTVKERDFLEDIGVDGTIMLKEIWNK